MSGFDQYLAEQPEGPEFKEEWDAQAPERAIIQATIEARITQKELVARRDV